MKILSVIDTSQSRPLKYGIRFSRYYPTGTPALELLNEEGQSLKVLTINTDEPPPEGCIWLHEARMLDLLVNNRVVAPNHVAVQKRGVGEIRAYRLLMTA